MPEEKMIPQKPVLEVMCAIQGALGEDNQKVFTKASMSMGKVWGKTKPPAENADALMKKIATYLRDELKFAQT
jgi:hypothetical protein